MTAQEAIEVIWFHNGVKWDWTDRDCVEAIHLAFEALEKQIPKKPLHSGLDYDCPNCLENVGTITSRGKSYTERCCKCGQAIDWRE